MVNSYAGDPKPRARIQDPQLLRELHLHWRECVLCGSIGFSGSGENKQWVGLSLHHISKHPRDDVEGNLVLLCGSGTTGCHGKIEHHNETTIRQLGSYILRNRGDTIAYLYERMGATQAQEFMRLVLLIQS